MNRNQRTLIALSGTETDRPLIRYARILAGMGFARHYYFVHVRTPARIAEERVGDDVVRHTCDAMVAEEFGSPRPDVSRSTHVVVGIRVDELLDFITQNRCDMVLLGHRQNRSGQRSLARRLAMIAPCSVWMLPEGAPGSIRNILVPIDFSDHSRDSMEVAVSIARAAGLPSCLGVHVFSDPDMIQYDDHTAEIRRNEREAFQKFIAPIDCKGVDIESTFVEGNSVGSTLLHVAQRYSADLIVMNTRGRSRAASILLGSVTTQVMVESPVAVLAVKHFGAMLNLFQALQQSQFWNVPNPKMN